MYKTRYITKAEIIIMADFWYKMATEMGEVDGVPQPDYQRLEEVKNLFIKEHTLGNLMFRVALDSSNNIVACAGGLIRTEYPYPLAMEQSLFGWIISVYTNKEHRQNRLASILVDEICLWLKQKGASRARLWSSSTARSTYEKIGFQSMMDMTKALN
ncbi:GNAT family N-acetyltransferase [Ornithinibacillus scapharcae]|uniref:GNAT family N-acetyltransferase n=1 Tax=Ornithinibacillus scapharcae TaxID=1147159 RepID=UPI000225C0F3|nr:GNAT family N-acetyltransferase [Ornithinibacillus scapharcae]